MRANFDLKMAAKRPKIGIFEKLKNNVTSEKRGPKRNLYPILTESSKFLRKKYFNHCDFKNGLSGIKLDKFRNDTKIVWVPNQPFSIKIP